MRGLPVDLLVDQIRRRSAAPRTACNRLVQTLTKSGSTILHVSLIYGGMEVFMATGAPLNPHPELRVTRLEKSPCQPRKYT